MRPSFSRVSHGWRDLPQLPPTLLQERQRELERQQQLEEEEAAEKQVRRADSLDEPPAGRPLKSPPEERKPAPQLGRRLAGGRVCMLSRRLLGQAPLHFHVPQLLRQRQALHC